jgi:glycosyltransferase involved in cell wall biosynthesis
LRILYISPCEPLATGSGSNKRSSVALEALSQLGEVFYLCAPTSTCGPQSDVKDGPEWRQKISAMLYGGELYAQTPLVWKSFVAPGLIHRILKRAWITAGEMVTTSAAQTQSIVSAIGGRFGPGKFDVIYVFQAHAASFVADALPSLLKNDGAVLVDWDAAERPAAAEQYRFRSNGLRGQLTRSFNDLKLAWFERKLLQLADVTICAANYDVAYFNSRHPRGKVAAILNCTEVPPDRLPFPANPKPPQVLFVGLINYWPNRHGLNLFLDEIWPAVRAQHPDAEFSIVGRGVTPDIQKWHGTNGINVVGAVEALEPYYAKCHVAVAPMQFSVGSSIKILEALAFNRPIVAFEAATRRHELQDGVEAFIATTSKEFSEKLNHVLSNLDVGRTSAGKGYRYVNSHYSRNRVLEQSKTLIGNILHKNI